MTYGRIGGLGDGTTEDPPPSYYCKPYIGQIAALQQQLVEQARGFDQAKSSMQAGAAGAAAGCAQGTYELQKQLDAAKAEITKKTTQLKQIVHLLVVEKKRVCPVKPCSCKWWIIATMVSAGAAITVLVTKKNEKNKKVP